MRSSLPFDYIDPDLPTLSALREQEGLDQLAEQAAGEYDLIRRVMQHVKEQWDQSWHAPMQHVNALEVLEDVRSGLRGNFCVYFTHVLLQALWSLGIPCRYVHVAVHHWQSHSTSECWSNEHRKWITVDSDFNLCYMRAEQATPELGPVVSFEPQNARDIQNAWRHGEMDRILPRQGTRGIVYDPATRLGNYYGGVFGYVADYQRALETGPPEWDGQRCQWFVWQEPDDPLADYHRHNFELTHGNGICTPVSDPDQYYWPLNETVIEQPGVDGDRPVQLRFETFTPFFDTFLIRRDNGPWHELRADRLDGHRAFGSFQWEAREARNALELRSRNRAGRLGPITAIEIASPPCVPPEPTSHWAGMGGETTCGAFDVADGRLYVPLKVAAKVIVVRGGSAEREIGTPIPLPPMGGPPPVEPWNEAVNLARAAVAPAGHLLAPQACAVAPDGTLYVADAENYRVQPFAPDGAPGQPWGRHGSGDGEFLHVRAIAVASDGSVYVADSGYAGPVGLRTEHVSRLRRFDSAGGLEQLIAGSGALPGQVCSPAGLCVDGGGKLWVADGGNHRVQCFAAASGLVACWGERGEGWGGLRHPTGVAVAPDGCVFVADPQHRCVWKFDSSGQPLARIAQGHEGAALLRPGRVAIEGDVLYIGDVGTLVIHEYRL